jgi:hypothetical protein
MPGKCFPLVRGRVMRATRLDECGRIKPAAVSSIATDGFVSVALTANIEEGEEITVVNAAGRTCVKDAAVPTLNGYGVAVTFCDVNPELYAMMTNQRVVFDSDGLAVGFRVNTKVDVSKANFALEVWSNVPGVACDPLDDAAQGAYGYTLLPFISGGVLGDFTIENGAVSFTLQNANTKDGTGWGKGPYDVVNGAAGAEPLLEDLDANDHLHVQFTTVAPPEPSCDSISSGPEATTATAGSPGEFTPTDSYPPGSFSALQADPLTASPTSAWTSGQYIVLGDNTNAYWTGTAWAAGKKA